MQIFSSFPYGDSPYGYGDCDSGYPFSHALKNIFFAEASHVHAERTYHFAYGIIVHSNRCIIALPFGDHTAIPIPLLRILFRFWIFVYSMSKERDLAELPTTTAEGHQIRNSTDGSIDTAKREAARFISSVGGQGVINCNCRGSCTTNSCSCRKACRLCTFRSAILLETNGRASSSKQTKHDITVKYYFLIKDKVDLEELTIEHCPSDEMWTDINTKPKQGAVFQVFRGHVMGIPADYNDTSFAAMCSFRPPAWVPELVPMLPIPKDWLATQECVGGQVTNKEVEIWDKSPTKNRRVTFEPKSQLPAKVRFVMDMEVCAAPAEQNQRARIKIVDGRAWSPGIYQAVYPWM
jgi:hypothetical protein